MKPEVVHSIGKFPIPFRANSSVAWKDRDWRILVNYFKQNSLPELGMLKGLKQYVKDVNDGTITFAPDKSKRKRRQRNYYINV